MITAIATAISIKVQALLVVRQLLEPLVEHRN